MIKSFGETIKEIRLKQEPKITLRQEAEILNINLSLLSNIENGNKPASIFNYERMKAFSKLMKLSIDEEEYLFDLQAEELNIVPLDINKELLDKKNGKERIKELREKVNYYEK